MSDDDDVRFSALLSLMSVLEKQNVDYRVGTGTLLGFIRDGGFIPWDWDVGIDVPAEHLLEQWEELVREIGGEGFSIKWKEKTILNGKISCVKNDVEFEIMGWRRDMFGGRRRRRLFIPAEVWQGGGVVEVGGRVFRTYSKPERYLEHFYGDWRAPVRASTESEKSSYMATGVRRRDYLDSALYMPQWLSYNLRKWLGRY